MAAVASAREQYTDKIAALSVAAVGSARQQYNNQITAAATPSGGDAGADLAASLMAGLCSAGAEDRPVSASPPQGFPLNIDAHEFVPTSHTLNAYANIFTPSFADLL